jgi:hypothetical protein
MGVASMLLATKVEDIYSIPMSDFVTKISHSKFCRYYFFFFLVKGIKFYISYNSNDIVKKEWEILRNLNFNIVFPTIYDFLRFYLKKLGLLESDCSQPKNVFILKATRYLLKVVLAHLPFIPFSCPTVALSVLNYTMELYLKFLSEKFKGNHEELNSIRLQREQWVNKICILDINIFR